MIAVSPRPVRRTAHEREERRIRIMAMVRSGYSYEAISREESLSRERIRQIVAQSLDVDEAAPRINQARVQLARLEPALRLAARGVDNGKLSAIPALLKVLDRMDKYAVVAEPAHREYEGMHERLMKKINDAAVRIKAHGVSSAEAAPEALLEDEEGALAEPENSAPAASGFLDL